MSPVAEYKGPFGKAQAERLLWRAGFGARPGEAEALAKLGFKHAVHALTRPPSYALNGPAPTADKGRPLSPAAVVGDDHLFWLDKMVRTNAPLIERMTLIWHSWFATSNQGVASQQLMLKQNDLFRGQAFGSFSDLLVAVTQDPAMLIWLNGNQNVKAHPNENYAREMMELFTLGADRGAYTETDVRENARALTGWTGSVNKGIIGNFTFNASPARHRLEDDLRPHGQLHLDGLVQPLRQPSAPPLVLRREALELLHPDAAGHAHALGAVGAVRRERLRRCTPSSRRSSSIRASTRARAW